jgi:hypothetical protein
VLSVETSRAFNSLISSQLFNIRHTDLDDHRICNM